MNAGYIYDKSYQNYFQSKHAGIDFDSPAGTQVKSLTSGKVTDIWSSASLGTALSVTDSSGRQWVYGHLQDKGSLKIGDLIEIGQTIGKVGNQKDARHLHLGVFTNSSWKNAGFWGRNESESKIKQLTMSPLHAYWELRNSQNSTVNVPSPVLSGGVEYGSYKPNVTKEFLNKVSAISQNLSVPGEYLVAVMGFETGGSYSPSKKNGAGSGATGLIQFMPSTAIDLGTSTQALAKMTALQQLDYVEKYLKSHAGKLKTLEDVYMAVLYPKAIGKGTNYTLFKKSDGKSYSQNKGLDINGDSSITVGEATTKVRGYLPGSGLFA